MLNKIASAFCFVLAICLAIAAWLGPLFTETVRFHMGRNAIVQYIGGEVITLIAAAIIAYAGWLFLTNGTLAAAIVIGPAGYAVYTMVSVVLGQEFAQFPDGNSERYMLVYMGITGLAVAVITLAANHLVQYEISPSARWRTITMWVLGLKAVLFTAAWLGQIADVYNNGWTDLLREQRMLFWLVKYLDLGFMIPLGFLIILLIQQKQPLAPMLVLLQMGFTMVMMSAIVGMTINMWREGEEGGSLGLAGFLIVMAVLAASVWVPWVRAAANARPIAHDQPVAQVGEGITHS